MKMIELLKGYEPMAFGSTAEGSPLLRWLMVDGAGNPRMDVASWVWDQMRKAEVMRYNAKTGLWYVNEGEGVWETADGQQKKIRGELIGAALARCGGKADFPTLKARLESDTGKAAAHWSFVRAIRRAEERGWLDRLPGRGKGYLLTDEGRTQFHAELLEGETTAQELAAADEALARVLTPIEDAALIARLTGAPTSQDDWFSACAGAILPGRLSFAFQLIAVAERNPGLVELIKDEVYGYSYRNLKAPAEPVDLD
jgi:hypothetical protein